jgi:hypothetical protein
MFQKTRLNLSAIGVAMLAFLVLLPLGAMAQIPNPPPASSQLLNPEELDALVDTPTTCWPRC